MRLLLDTHILLWWLEDNPAKPEQAVALLADASNEIFVSAISIWEIAIKARLGKITADIGEIHNAVWASGFRALPFTFAHAAAVAALPDHHRDPFDRALVAQAQVEPLHLLTHDTMVAAYDGNVLFI